MMIRVREVSGMVIAGCLLGVLMGTADARAATGKVTLAASDFNPKSDGTTYDNNGSRLIGEGGFLASVDLPPGASVTEVRLFVLDEDPAHDASLSMIRYAPRTQSEPEMATVGSKGSKAFSRTFGTTLIANNLVQSSHRVYLSLDLPMGNTGLSVFGADVSYSLP